MSNGPGESIELAAEGLSQGPAGEQPREPRVLDAGPLIAFLRQEPGWEVVAALLADPAVACYAHAVNVCETYYLVARQSDRASALAAVGAIAAAGVVVREDLGPALWQDVGDLIALVRNTPGLALSLADAFGLALARRLECPFVSTDRGELEPLAALGLATVEFIR